VIDVDHVRVVADRRRAGVGRVVVQCVDAAEQAEGRVDHGLDRALVPELDLHADRAPAGVLDLLGHPFGAVDDHVGDDHRGAVGGELPRGRGADAGRRAHDDGHLAREAVRLSRRSGHRAPTHFRWA
jgi:hypothetical protein